MFFRQNEVNICVLPMYHIFAMNVTLSGMMYQGGLTITVPKFEPEMFLKAMLEYRPTNLQLAPPLVGFLANHPAVTQEHLASLNTVCCNFCQLLSYFYFFKGGYWSRASWTGTYRPLLEKSSPCQVNIIYLNCQLCNFPHTII